MIQYTPVFQARLIFSVQFLRLAHRISRLQQRQSTPQQHRDRSDDHARQTLAVPRWVCFHTKLHVHKIKPALSHKERRTVNTADTRRKNAQQPLLSQKLHHRRLEFLLQITILPHVSDHSSARIWQTCLILFLATTRRLRWRPIVIRAKFRLGEWSTKHLNHKRMMSVDVEWRVGPHSHLPCQLVRFINRVHCGLRCVSHQQRQRRQQLW